jgi:protein-S-isoprenylcysteine O-methyltransferase Ste14
VAGCSHRSSCFTTTARLAYDQANTYRTPDFLAKSREVGSSSIGILVLQLTKIPFVRTWNTLRRWPIPTSTASPPGRWLALRNSISKTPPRSPDANGDVVYKATRHLDCWLRLLPSVGHYWGRRHCVLLLPSSSDYPHGDVRLHCRAALFAGGNVSPSVREDRSNRWVLIPFSVLPLAAGFFAPYTDRIGFWTVDGESIRWIGVLMGGVGSALRVAPVYVLGDRFSGLVAIQSGHTLVTTGLYSRIRNPSYLGLLLGSVGWALAFRSGVGLILTALLIPPLVARMNSEERLLHSQFGAEYQAYRNRTSRLIPHVY